MKIADRLTTDLQTALDAEHVEVHDESARHRGHDCPSERLSHAIVLQLGLRTRIP